MPPAVLPVPADVPSRSLYLYESYTVAGGASPGTPNDAEDVLARSLYLYESYVPGGHPIGGELLDTDDVLARILYLYVNIVHDRTTDDVLARSLYTYEAYTNDEVFPWLERIVPTEQYPGGQVEIMGDGFAADEAAEGGSVRLGVYDPLVSGPGAVMGVVSWQTRSPGLWPANSGIRSTAAIVVVVPDEAESGMVSAELTV